MSILRESDSNSLAGRALTFAGDRYIADFAPPAKRAKWEARFAALQHSAAPKEIDLDSIYPSWHGGFGAPFGYVPNGFGNYYSDRIDSGYYHGFTNAYTKAAADRIISEIEDRPQEALLVPEYFESWCTEDADGARKLIGILNVFPYFGKEVNKVDLHQPVCDFIVANYRMEVTPDIQNFGYGLWVRKAADGS
jgi:hypothetical protein